MPQEIYNEGRVVGLSAWEIFVKNLEGKIDDPSAVPSEAQWLSSMIGSGMSMLLQIPAGTQAGIRDFALPSGNNLAASGIIWANPFLGDAVFDNGWAVKVTSYSPLIANDSSAAPTSHNVPSGTYAATQYSNMLVNFLKITDGIVYQSEATWIELASANKPPRKDIDPDYNNSYAVIRLNISADIDADVNIIFTGFQNKRILQAFAGYATNVSGATGGSTDPTANDWVNGGLLGPESTPWATKIMFSMPSAAMGLTSTMTRKAPSDADYTEKTVDGITFKEQPVTVNSNALIDFNSINLTDYYIKHYNAGDYAAGVPWLVENVTSAPLGSTDSYNSLVALYPGMTAAKIEAATDASTVFPPALYAAQVTGTGADQKLIPIDVAAPGTVKFFNNATDARNYLRVLPNNFAAHYDSSSFTFTFLHLDALGQWEDPNSYTCNPVQDPNVSVGIKLNFSNTIKPTVLALSDLNGNAYSTAGSVAVIGQNGVGDDGVNNIKPMYSFNWADLLEGLKSNYSIDPVGKRLRTLGNELAGHPLGTVGTSGYVPSATTIGIDPQAYNRVYSVGTQWILLNPDSQAGVDNWWDGGADSLWVTSSHDSDSRYLGLNIGRTAATLWAGKPYIQFNDTTQQSVQESPYIRLYVCKHKPTDTNIPVGSIGIGW